MKTCRKRDVLPPPLWGRVGEGGKPHAWNLPFTPLSVFPPQGGRERWSRGIPRIWSGHE